MVLSTEEAAPVGDIGGTNDNDQVIVVDGVENGEKADENSSIEDEKKQDDESPALNEESPPKEEALNTPPAPVDEPDTLKEDKETPVELSEVQEDSPEEQEDSPAAAPTGDVKSQVPVAADTSPAVEDTTQETKEDTVVENNEQKAAIAEDDVDASDKTSGDTPAVEAGAVGTIESEGPEEPETLEEPIAETSKDSRNANADIAAPAVAAAAVTAAAAVVTPSAPPPEVAPTASDGNQGGDIEQGIPPTEDTKVEMAPDPPESPSREKELTVEHGVPPETPVREDKKEIDPESPSRETEADDSFESTEPVNEDYNSTTKKANRRRKHCIFGTICVAIVLGALLGILYGTGVVGGSGEPSPSTSPPPPAPSPGDDVPPPAPTDGDQTDKPTDPPTNGPVLVDDPLLEALKGFGFGGLEDLNSPQFKAYQWMANADPLTNDSTDPIKLRQRYALATMLLTLQGEIPFYATRDECAWPIVECGTHNATNLFGTEPWQVTEINMARSSLSGSIPEEIGLLAPSLVSVDMAENPNLTGSIPESLYSLLNLKYLYLSNNGMSGTLSESIGNLQALDSLYLGGNNFSGSIPFNIGSRSTPARPLRYLILHNNQFEGPIPTEMRLRSLFHLDLSFNNLSGPLPADIGEDFNRLKQLYLDHNQFSGTIPDTYAQAGGGRLYVLSLDNNNLTGGVPTGWDKNNLFLDTITVQGNQLTEPIDKEICKFSALVAGELVQVGADCEICTCDVLCDDCY